MKNFSSIEDARLRRIKLTLEYDGTDFKGWQVQNGGEAGAHAPLAARTVQGEVELALSQTFGEPVRIAGASRTDAGVHARGQVATFIMPERPPLGYGGLVMALNSRMDKDVCAIRADEVPLEFHPQRDAIGKLYTYSLVSRRERSALLHRTHWHVRFPLEIERMRAGAAHLIGEHDFTSFATRLADTQATRAEEGKRALTTVRTITRIEIRAEPDYPGRMTLAIEGSGFLYQMIRTIAGSLVDVGRGFRPPEWIAEALAARDRRKAGPTAPPHGLCLERVDYNV